MGLARSIPTSVLFIASLALTCFEPGTARGEKVTVAELEQVLTAAKSTPDAELARHLANLELTERLSPTTLAQLKPGLPGNKAYQELVILSDESAFLDPPAREIPAKAAPDVPEQRRIMGLVVGYVTKAIPQLPNFVATRETTRFEDSPQLQKALGTIPYQPLHFVGASSATVLYRDGREEVDNGQGHGKKTALTANGLTTWGVFGPILGTVLVDAAQSKLVWSHWEQGSADLEAVFSYFVPRDKSHYEINYCCTPHGDFADMVPFRQLSGYHGEIAVSPQDGSVVRLSLEADLKPADPITMAALVVEFGPVEIGGRTYICPLKSISLSTAEELQFASESDPYQIGRPALTYAQHPLKTMLNDVVFEHYHRFGSDMRIVTADNGELSANPAAPKPEAALPSTVQPQPVMNTESGQETTNLASPAAAPAVEATATRAPAPPEPEISVGPASGIPDTPPDTEARISAGRLVKVGVVVYDQKGHTVRDLKQGDFEVYDNGRKQVIGEFGTSAAGVPRETASTTSPGSTILLIDASHIQAGDLKRTREQILKFLAAAAAGQRIGLYSIAGDGFQVLAEVTTDHAGLIERLRNWTPGSPTNATPTAIASDLAQASMKILASVAQHLATVAGHKNVVWISSDSVFVELHKKSSAGDRGSGSRPLDVTKKHALEAMNRANASVIPFDVSPSATTQMAGGAIGADAYSFNKDPFAQIQNSQAINLPMQEPIRELATSTGGLTIQHSSSLAKALSQIAEDDEATYLIGFSPQQPGDGLYHAISIKLAGRSGFTLRYRTGYMSEEEPATPKERFQKTVWQPTDVSEITVTAAVAQGQSGTDVKIHISTSALDLQQQGGRWMDKLDIFFVQRDDADLHAEVEGQTLSLRLTADTYVKLQAAGVPFQHVVRLNQGTSSLRVLVVEEKSGRMGSLTIPAKALRGAS